MADLKDTDPRFWELSPPPARVKPALHSVIFLPPGVSPHTAMPAQLTKITVAASNAHEARWCPDAQRLVRHGFIVAEVTIGFSETERIAAQNARAAAAVADPLPADLQAPGRRFAFQR